MKDNVPIVSKYPRSHNIEHERQTTFFVKISGAVVFRFAQTNRHSE